MCLSGMIMASIVENYFRMPAAGALYFIRINEFCSIFLDYGWI